MRKLLFLVLAAVLLGGCTQVEDDEEKEKDFDDGTIENINATLTVINTYDDERELYVFYCKTKEDTMLYVSKTLVAGETVQIPITKNKVKISYRTDSFKDLNGIVNLYHQTWGFVNGNFTMDLKNGNEKENFDIISIGIGATEP